MRVYSSPKPFPHILIHGFLQKKEYAAVDHALQKEKFSLKNSDLFQFQQTADLRTAEQETLRTFQKWLSSQHALIFSVTKKKTKGQVDAFGSLYSDTDYLLPHDDRLESRKVAFILYFSTLSRKNGGALCLYSSHGRPTKPTATTRRYQPKENLLVLFPVTRTSWHSVSEVVGNVKRYAIGGWFRG